MIGGWGNFEFGGKRVGVWFLSKRVGQGIESSRRYVTTETLNIE